MKIIKLTRDKRIRERFYVKFDDGDSFPVSAETVVKHGLVVGKNIDNAQLSDIREEDEKKRAVDASFNLLSYSQRSRKELEKRLKLKKYSAKAAGHAVERLSELGYLNDRAFATNLAALRASQLKGPELIRFEMKSKGIPPEVISETLAENRLTSRDEALKLLPAAKKKLSLMRNIPQEASIQRLMAFFARRGFSVETVRDLIRLLKIELDEE